MVSPTQAAWLLRQRRKRRAFAEGGGDADPVPPEGFVFLVDSDGRYLTDEDGHYLVEAI